jgi:hypothetical protein
VFQIFKKNVQATVPRLAQQLITIPLLSSNWNLTSQRKTPRIFYIAATTAADPKLEATMATRTRDQMTKPMDQVPDRSNTHGVQSDALSEGHFKASAFTEL